METALRVKPPLPLSIASLDTLSLPSSQGPMYFTKDLRQATLGKDRRSVSRGLAGAFPSSLSSSSYTGSNSHQPSSYLRCSTFDGDFNTKSNLDPLASTRSSSSSSSEAQLVVRIQPSSFQEDEALQSDSDLSLVGSGGDEFNGFFSPLDFDEPRSTLPSLSPSSLPRSSLPHSSAPSTLPIPSPLLLQSFDSTRPVNWNSSEWDSLNPFANEGLPKDKNDALGKPTAGFAIIKSSEEIRTLKVSFFCVQVFFLCLRVPLLSRRTARFVVVVASSPISKADLLLFLSCVTCRPAKLVKLGSRR